MLQFNVSRRTARRARLIVVTSLRNRKSGGRIFYGWYMVAASARPTRSSPPPISRLGVLMIPIERNLRWDRWVISAAPVAAPVGVGIVSPAVGFLWTASARASDLLERGDLRPGFIAWALPPASPRFFFSSWSYPSEHRVSATR